jgi:hypothetical protein
MEERQAASSNSYLGSELFLFQPQGPFTPPLPSCVPSTDLADFPTSYFSTEASFFNLRDQALCGDWFLVYDNGVLLGATSDPGCVTPQEVRDRSYFTRFSLARSVLTAPLRWALRVCRARAFCWRPTCSTTSRW